MPAQLPPALPGLPHGVYENSGIAVRIPPERVYEISRKPLEHIAPALGHPLGRRVDPTEVPGPLVTLQDGTTDDFLLRGAFCLGKRVKRLLQLLVGANCEGHKLMVSE